MISRMILAGFGGQGILLMGYVLSHGAMARGLNVTYLPAYGAEMRGGTANCTVTISDEEIASPVASEPDVLVAMNGPSLDRFESMVRPDGTILINASLMQESPRRSDVREVRVDTAALAREVGAERAANMVMLGALVQTTGVLSIEDTVQGMAAATTGKEKLFALNKAAIERGALYIRDANLHLTVPLGVTGAELRVPRS
jgi:2-oxoglutarate ferredoxin oxidoreductase subunit gamma